MARRPKTLESKLSEELKNLEHLNRQVDECNKRIKVIRNDIRERDKELIFSELERKGISTDAILKYIRK